MPSPAERFKRMLFADQSLEELVATMSPKVGVLHDARELLAAGNAAGAEAALTAAMLAIPEETTPWHRMLLAASQLRRENRQAGVKSLRAVAEGASESRLRLWGWRALRDAGIAPEAPDEVLGAVVEVHVEAGLDTLAANADGTARYLVHTGQKIIWDRPDDRLAAAVAAVISAARAAAAHVPPGALPGEPAHGIARHTLLTPGGLRSIEDPFSEVAGDGNARSALFAAFTALADRIVAVVKG